VEVSDLRAKFPDMPKADFDAAMVKLNEQGKIALHRHDKPTEADKASAVKIKDDYHTAVTIREQAGVAAKPAKVEVSERAKQGDLPTKFAATINPRDIARAHGLPDDFYSDDRTQDREGRISGETAVNPKYDPEGAVIDADFARREAMKKRIYDDRKKYYDQKVKDAIAAAVNRAVGSNASPIALKGESKGHVMGFGLGSLQGLFERKGAPKSSPTNGDVEGASLGQAAGKVLQRAGNEIRTLWTSMDFSAPLSQGALLSIAHPIKGAQSFGKMFRSLSQAQSDAIDAEIAFHPLRKLGEKADLYLAVNSKLKGDASQAEEAYSGGFLSKLPGIRHSDRAYRTYLDTLRLSTWESYVKALQADGHTFENNPKAYKDAASFINIATGRGQLKRGGKLEKASDIMGSVLFAPRNMISNFQVLDPVRYASLAPGARKIVLKDALKAFGAIVGTAAVLKAAGVNVGFNPENDDFMIARNGNTRYDLTFGKRTQVQFLARMVMGAYRQATGEGNLPGEDVLSVASKFAQSKLSPVLSTAKTFLTGRDFKGESVADKSAKQIAWETAAPILWRDFVEAYQEEGKAGVAKTLPAIIGARVNTYPDRAKPAFLNVPDDLRAEQKRGDETRPYLEPRKAQGPNEKDETPQEFEARKAKADEWTQTYGEQLVASPGYKSAEPELQKAARAYLNQAIAGQSGEQRPSLYLLNPARVMATVRESERKKQRKAARAGSGM
jgi:hypothetical protein